MTEINYWIINSSLDEDFTLEKMLSLTLFSSLQCCSSFTRAWANTFTRTGMTAYPVLFTSHLSVLFLFIRNILIVSQCYTLKVNKLVHPLLSSQYPLLNTKWLHFIVFVAPCCRLSGLAGRHIAQAQLMHHCLTAVKTSMLVIQRSQEAVSASLQATQDGCRLEDTLSSLLSCYIHILTDGKK